MYLERFLGPLTPGQEEAQRWAEEELLRRIYHARPSLGDRILAWFLDLFNQYSDGEGVTGLVLLITPLIIAIAFLAFRLVKGPIRRASRIATQSNIVLENELRTAAELRAAAQRALAAGDYNAAVLDSFRAIAVSFHERALLEERAGRTAVEIAQDGATSFPLLASDLARAARLFDAICYGHGTADHSQAQWLISLDRELSKTRPQRPEIPVAVS